MSHGLPSSDYLRPTVYDGLVSASFEPCRAFGRAAGPRYGAREPWRNWREPNGGFHARRAPRDGPRWRGWAGPGQAGRRRINGRRRWRRRRHSGKQIHHPGTYAPNAAERQREKKAISLSLCLSGSLARESRLQPARRRARRKWRARPEAAFWGLGFRIARKYPHTSAGGRVYQFGGRVPRFQNWGLFCTISLTTALNQNITLDNIT